MELISLSMKNFKQYRSQSVEFSGGLTGIIGRNGAGKSTIFDSVLLSLYGIIPAGKEYMRYSGAGLTEPVEVRLVFEARGKRYSVFREFRGKALTAYASLHAGDESPVATGVSEVTREIEKIIMAREAFLKSVFSGQKDLGALSSVTGAPRRELVRKMAGMDRLDAVQGLMREDRNRLKNELAGQEKLLLSGEESGKLEEEKKVLEAGIVESEKKAGKTGGDLENAGLAYVEAKAANDEQERIFREHKSLEGEIIRGAERLDNNIKNISEKGQRLRELHKERDRQNTMWGDEKEYLAAKKEDQALNDAQKIFIKAGEIRKGIKKATFEIEEMKRETAAVQERIKDRVQLESGLDEERKRIENTQAAMEAMNIELNNLIASRGHIMGLLGEREESIVKIKKAGRESKCPTCLRPLKDAYDSTLEKLGSEVREYREKELCIMAEKIQLQEKEISDKKKDLKNIRESAAAMEKNAAAMREAAENLRARVEEMKKKEEEVRRSTGELDLLGDAGYDEKAHFHLKEKLVILTKIHESFVALTEKVKEIPILETELNKLKSEGDGLKAAHDGMTEKLAGIGYSAEKFNSAKDARDRIEKERDSLRDLHQKQKDEINSARMNLKELTGRLSGDNKRREAYMIIKADYLDLDRLDLFMDEFKKAALDRVRPAIAGYAGSLFNELTRGRYQEIRLDEDFEFFIMDEGEYYPIKRFSGGEIDLANLCLRIAISRAVSSMSGAGPAGFLGFDEIFGSQDGERRLEILGAFLRLQEMYRQIFIVSHVEDVKEEFPNIMEVVRTEEGSVVRFVKN